MDCSSPGSSVHRILQARILEWVAMPPPQGNIPDPETEAASLKSPVVAGRFFTTSTTWEALYPLNNLINCVKVFIPFLQMRKLYPRELKWFNYGHTDKWRSRNCLLISRNCGFPGDASGKESTCNAGDPGLIPGSGRSPGGRNGYPLQYSCLENSMDREAWKATESQNWTCVSTQHSLNEVHAFIRNKKQITLCFF